MDLKEQGILIEDSKTFYRLECGQHFVFSVLDKLKTILMARDLIKPTINNNERGTSYRFITIEEAQLKDYKIEAVYLNQMVKEQAQIESTTEFGDGGWKTG